MMDDMGYGDVGCFGSVLNKTPAMDKLAEEGTIFTSFNTQPICGPTRAAVLTGCYPMRVAEIGNRKRHHPLLHRKEILIPKVLKTQGYISAAIGKWDLNRNGRNENYIHPLDFGFDYYYGRQRGANGKQSMENRKVIAPIPQELLTQSEADKALEFIEKNQDKPFFLYLAHSMPHEPIAASKQFRGKSKNGIYGDVIEELDWNIGRVAAKVDELGLAQKTIIIVTSDNGPWPYWTGPEESGVAGPLRGQKTETWEGGVRTPFIARAPGMIPVGRVVNGLIGDVDILPTFASFAGAELPKDRVIDGIDLRSLFLGETNESPVEYRLFYYDWHLQAVRKGKWKLILERPARPAWLSDNGIAKKWRGRDVEAIPTPELYDLEADIGETTDLAAQYPELVEELLAYAEKTRNELGDYDRIGSEARFFDPQPKRTESRKWLKKN